MPEQDYALDRYVREKGLVVVETVTDEGDSGANPNWAGLLRTLELARAGEIDLVISLWRDRLFRDIYARRGFEQDIAEYGVRTLALNDTGSLIGDGMLDLLAEQQRADMGQKVRNGRKSKARTGKLPGVARVSWSFRLTEDKSNFEVEEKTMRGLRHGGTGPQAPGVTRMVKEYLADLPHLIDPEATIREYETVPEPRTDGNPLGAYRLTPERVRHKDEEKLEAERQATLEARRDRFRDIYTELGLTVVCYQDRSLGIRWSGGCSRWHKGTFGCCTA